MYKRQDGIPVPSNFELTQPILQPGESSKSLKAKARKSQHEGLGKRLTQSQAKKEKVSIEQNRKNLCSLSSFNGSREFSPQLNKSSETTESMAKLALESIGELLGVKVIDKKEVALKRITSGLKKERKASATHRTK